MRITGFRLRNYKRFTDLHVVNIPPTARLVVMVGPNGAGKSSVFDAFLLKAQAQRSNQSLNSQTYAGYLLKDNNPPGRPTTTHEVANSITINLDRPITDWSKIFTVRSPYRHEADFANTNLAPVRPAYETPRFHRIIDQDQSVSANYARLARSALHGALKGEPDTQSLGAFRTKTLGDIKSALQQLFDNPSLGLQDLGTGLDTGSFRFQKGSTEDFHYKNLSGGEKAAFDLLLDIFVNRPEYDDAIYCIDEPESHTASAVHGRLLNVMLELIPESSQLWLATHSTGFVRKAVDLNRQENNVVFLDFSGHDFDDSVTLSPTNPNRTFFRRMYDVLQDDLAGLIAPSNIVFCEGAETTDAQIYNRIFEESYPDTLFVARGGSSAVEKGDMIPVLEAIVPSVSVSRLIDRDDMPDPVREEKMRLGIGVLRRREIENYLWDKSVVRKALANIGAEATEIHEVLKSYPFHDCNSDDMKSNNQLQVLFETIRRMANIANPGRNRREFAFAHLAIALRETEEVYEELAEDIFRNRV